MATDFFDDDLVKEREAEFNIKLDGKDAKIPRDGIIPSSKDIPARPIRDLPLVQLARHKQEMTEQMAGKAQELDLLKARQDELERERRLLEEIREKQEQFEEGRREVRAHLNESLVRLDKERAQAERMLQVVEEARRVFRVRLDEIGAINEDAWEDAQLLDELNTSLALLENARSDFNTTMAKVEAVHPSAPVVRMKPPSTGMAAGAHAFAYWFRAGLAFLLPLMLLLALLAAAWMAVYIWVF